MTEPASESSPSPASNPNVKAYPRIPWRSLLAQGAVIVTSILLAFGVDAWWAARLNANSEQGHRAALRRDFLITQERATESLRVARTADETLVTFLRSMAKDDGKPLDRSAFIAVLAGLGYEVFSAPRGAYEAMVNSGQVELLQSRELKYALADFFGVIEDTRVSEAQLLKVIVEFEISTLFAEKIGWIEIYFSLDDPDSPIAPPLAARLASWRGDRELANWLAILAAHHGAVAEDYEFLVQRITKILQLLE